MNFCLLQAGADAVAGAGAAQQPSMISSLFPFILMIAILYFLLIRPQRKRQKELQGMIDNLQINDTVITNGGMIGKVVNIKKEKNIVVLRVDETTNTKIEFQKSAIAGLVKTEEKK
ncbi:MAG TPA: preprotein translocase subunit YajC [Candidatus Cloacimonadota bacterium]|nr:preprotein translocase subunit YajC [Candidatus Cloacimonadota bacterium]